MIRLKLYVKRIRCCFIVTKNNAVGKEIKKVACFQHGHDIATGSSTVYIGIFKTLLNIEKYDAVKSYYCLLSFSYFLNC
jgi:hypothetical protein